MFSFVRELSLGLAALQTISKFLNSPPAMIQTSYDALHNKYMHGSKVSSDINIFHYPDNGYIRIFGNLTNRLTG